VDVFVTLSNPMGCCVGLDCRISIGGVELNFGMTSSNEDVKVDNFDGDDDSEDVDDVDDNRIFELSVKEEFVSPIAGEVHLAFYK